jgi:hypothetical protein
MEEYCEDTKCPFRFLSKAGKTYYCERRCDAYIFRKWLYDHGYRIIKNKEEQ